MKKPTALAVTSLGLIGLILVFFFWNQTKIAPKGLGDGYAVAALTALKAIEEDTFVQKPDSNLVSRFTQEKIDAADALAVSIDQRNIMSVLNKMYAVKVNLNWQVKGRDLFVKIAHDDRLSSVFTAADKQRDEAEANQRSLAVATISGRLDKCFADMDSSLRARSKEVPASCKAPFE
jgi:hypothetical protein